jgi:hypothetical protein
METPEDHRLIVDHIVLTHRTDLKTREEPVQGNIYHRFHPRKEISGTFWGATDGELAVHSEEFQRRVLVFTGKRLFVGQRKELKAAIGKPVDISVDGTGKVLTMQVHEKDGVTRVLQDRFRTPLRPVSMGEVPPEGIDAYTVQQERTIGDRDQGADHESWTGRVLRVDWKQKTVDMESLIGGERGVTRVHLQRPVPAGVEVGKRQKIVFDRGTQGYTVTSPDRSVQRPGQDRGV